MAEKVVLREEDLARWLSAYGAAWEAGDPAAVVKLFTEDATYREKPFDTPMRGHDEIRAYWQQGPADGHREVAFQFQVWTVSGDQGYAGWQSRFRRSGSGALVELDGAFKLTFKEADGALLCSVLEEWWVKRETAQS
ncbi:MAG: nuclear transport factor 2 family protein [Pseudomonadota bacterium]